MVPLKIGAALPIAEVATYRDWLFDDQRDLELQDFFHFKVYRQGWQETVDRAKIALDGFEGRLGIHGPFWGLDMACADPDVAAEISKRFVQGVEAAAAVGAAQMVVHSPFDNWHEFNRFNVFDGQTLLSRMTETVATVMAPALKLAETHGVDLVVENIKDITPGIRRKMVEYLGSPAMKLSIDTGHAHIAGRASGAPPVDVFVSDAGNLLRHVHLQDGDGWADRHEAPGDGTIIWNDVFRALDRLDNKPHLVLELKRKDDILKGFRYLQDAGLAV